MKRAEEREIAFTQGIEQGISQGRSEGIAQGSYQTKLETAKTMLTMHYPFEDICKISGLSPEEVRSISNL